MGDNKVQKAATERGIVLELRPKSNEFDFSELAVDIANRKPVDLSSCDVKYHASIVDGFAPEFLTYIIQHGFTSFLRRGPLIETLVPPRTTPGNVQTLLQAFLLALSVTSELVIVDPYFFANSDVSYPQLVEQILSPVLPGLCNLTIVTLPNANTAMISDITNLLNTSAPHLRLTHKTSDVFHDRFWINPVLRKGFITGTSLNGLGRKYALIDHLQSSDAAEVLTALRSEGLL